MRATGRCHWGPPDSVRVPPKAEQLVGNESRWDPGQSRRVALALREAMRGARGYFGSDVHLAYRLAGALLRHESRQRGFRLAATQDVHFTEVGMRPRDGDMPGGGMAKQKRGWDDEHPHGEGCGCMSPDTGVMGTLVGKGIGVGGQIPE